MSTGRCAFIVLAHHKPEQALRLLQRLAPAPVFLHVDSGAEPEVYGRLLTGAAELPWVRMLPRSRSAWASWGQVQPALTGFWAAYELGDPSRTGADDAGGAGPVSHAVVLSGQDYPLVPVAEIDAFCARHPGESFMPHWRLPWSGWGAQGGMERLRYWHRPVGRKRVRLPVPRRLPAGITPYGGASWFMLSREAVAELSRFVAARPDVVRFYRHAWTPDEMFIHTALLNSPGADRIVNENLWHVEWTPNAKHPKVLDSADAGTLTRVAGRPADAGGEARAKLFARKFDPYRDPTVLDELDHRLAAA